MTRRGWNAAATAVAIRACVLRAIPSYQEVVFEEIARAVRNDWGGVSDRTMLRHLAHLHRARRVRRTGIRNHYVYSRRRRARVR